MKNLLLSLLLFTGLITACAKPELKPNIHGFKCYVNGTLWEPSKQGDMFADIVRIQLSDSGFSVSAVNSPQRFHINVHDPNGILPGNYILNSSESWTNFAVYDDNLSTDQYITDSSHVGTLTIAKLDRSSKIVSGIFQFNAYNKRQNKTVKVIQGEFQGEYVVR
ncbi:MAG: DUF6252 family protein [Bacteroidia bacterium]